MREVKEFRVGDRVIFYGEKARKNRERFDSFYPPIGTEGKVIKRHPVYDDIVRVQWPAGTTPWDGDWWCSVTDLQLIDEFMLVTVSMGPDMGDIEMRILVPQGEDTDEYVSGLLNRILKENVIANCAWRPESD